MARSVRYLNRAGAHVELRVSDWQCSGCRARGWWEPGTGDAGLARQAQDHADRCSALPRR